MTLKGDAKFKEKLTCVLKNDTRNLVNFYASSRKSKIKLCTLMVSFCPKHIKFQMKKHKRVLYTYSMNPL